MSLTRRACWQAFAMLLPRRPSDMLLRRAFPRSSNGAHTPSGPLQPSRPSGLQIFGRALLEEVSALPILDVDHTIVDRLLLVLEQILEDQLAPKAAACVHQRATLVELFFQLDGCEP
jgi:hypothetical protein